MYVSPGQVFHSLINVLHCVATSAVIHHAVTWARKWFLIYSLIKKPHQKWERSLIMSDGCRCTEAAKSNKAKTWNPPGEHFGIWKKPVASVTISFLLPVQCPLLPKRLKNREEHG